MGAGRWCKGTVHSSRGTGFGPAERTNPVVAKGEFAHAISEKAFAKLGFAHAISGKAIAKLDFAAAILSFADEKGEFAAAQAGFADEKRVLADEKPKLAEGKLNLAMGKSSFPLGESQFPLGNLQFPSEISVFLWGIWVFPRVFGVFPRVLRSFPSEIRVFQREFGRVLADLRVWKAFANRLFDALLFLRAGTSPIDTALDGVQQFKPILQRRILDRLPLVVTLFAREEAPFPADALDINLNANALRGDAFPTDFGFG